MVRRRHFRKISGSVIPGPGVETGSRSGWPGNMCIRLYRVVEKTFCGEEENKEDVIIYKEKLFRETCTDKYGNYRFLVPEGMYAVGLDTLALPDGCEAVEPELLTGYGRSAGADFHIRLKDRQEDFSSEEKPDAEAASAPSAVEKVEYAYRNGLIDEHNKILYTVYSVFNRRKLTGEYRSQTPIKSGTGALEEIRGYLGRPDADRSIAETARKMMVTSVPPLNKTFRSPSGFFNIHYTLTGDNAVAYSARPFDDIPPYIRAVGEAFDHVKDFTCGTRGFRQPLTEAGRKTMDVYIYNLNGLYGYTSPVNSLSSWDSNNAPCYICIDNSYSGSKGFTQGRNECMKVTAAHEFFHAVQYAYNMSADTWWKEASATWNEDEVYTGVNDYVRYIGNYFAAPHKTLEKSSYGGVIFAKYLSENHGGFEIIRKIWENQGSKNSSISAIDRTLKESGGGSDLGRVFDRFSAYNFNPSQYYKEGKQWKARVSVEKTYQAYPVSVTGGRLDHLSSSYQLFKPLGKGGPSKLKLVIQENNKARWGFKLQKRSKKDGRCSLTEIGMDRDHDRVEIVIGDVDKNFSEICLIPANLESDRDQLKYSYSASLV